tara:strand:- start:21635 stop:24109 length:2475 start_codon:yes stop_codon:yes gene_type:complete
MSTYVNDLRLEEIGSGERSGTWGTATNTNLSIVAEAFSYGSEAVANASTHTITMADGASDEVRSFYLKLTGGGQACTVTLAPNTVSKVWMIENTTSYTLTIKQGSGATVAIPAGSVKMVATDGAGTGGAVYDLMTDLDVEGTFNVAGAITGQSTITGTTITASTAFAPDASGGADIGTSSLEFGDVYIADDKYIQFGSDQDILVGYDEDGDNSLEVRQNVEGAALAITFKADQGDDNADIWKLNFADAGTISWQSKTSGSFATKLSLTPAGLLTTSGNIVIPDAGNIGSSTDPDAIAISSGGVVTMNQIPVFSAGINVSGGTIAGTLATAAQTNITSVGALGGGSISSGFGNIDNGSSSITTTGTITGGTITTSGTVNFGSLADGTITVTAFVDEDDMTSNSATLVPTQQSVKAYVDSQTGGGGSSGIVSTGTGNTAIGSTALDSVQSGGNYNAAFGFNAGTAVTTGDDNVLIGYKAGESLTTASRCIAIGTEALSSLAAHSGSGVTQANNIAIGHESMKALAATDNGFVATDNVCIGTRTGIAITTAYSCVLIGANVGSSLTTGIFNTLVGRATMQSLDTGERNVAVGYFCGGDANKSYTTTVGESSLYVNSGNGNTALGHQAGQQNTSGTNNLYLGKDSGITGSPGGSQSTGSNEIFLGDENITAANIQVDWTVASDQRDKTDFSALDIGLDFVNALKPYTFKWDKRTKYIDKSVVTELNQDGKSFKTKGWDYTTDLDTITSDGTHKEDWLDIGFKAQDVEALEKAAGYKIADKTNLTTTLTNDGKQYGIKYNKFVPILVKALQELSAKNDALEARIKTLEG